MGLVKAETGEQRVARKERFLLRQSPRALYRFLA